MANPEQRTVDSLVHDHAPLVGYAVTELAGRLPQTQRPQPLLAAGLDALRDAAHSYKENRHTHDFVLYAKPRIAAALHAAVVAAVPQADADRSAPQVNHLLAQVQPALDVRDALLLHSAHPGAFGGDAPRPRRGAGHYAAVAAASDYRSRVSAGAADTDPLQRKFGT